MQILILAGGLATRLGPLSQNCPKSMLDVAGKPFLAHQIELLKKSGITDILLGVGHLGEQIEEAFGNGRKYGVHIQYSREGENLLGTGGAVKKALPLLQNSFFVMYGDSYLMLDYQAIENRFREIPDKGGLMVVYKNQNQFDRSNIDLQDKLVTHYGYENPPHFYIDEGLSILRKDFFNALPDGKPFDLGEVFRVLVKDRNLHAFETPQRFYEIGSAAGLEELRNLKEKLNL